MPPIFAAKPVLKPARYRKAPRTLRGAAIFCGGRLPNDSHLMPAALVAALQGAVLIWQTVAAQVIGGSARPCLYLPRPCFIFGHEGTR
jgi:hypothetical protein